MNRQPGYYWVKLDMEQYAIFGDHWRAALWYCNNGDGSDFLWRIAGDDEPFHDSDFSDINETRIPPPDEAILTFARMWQTEAGPKNITINLPIGVFLDIYE